MAIFTGVLIRQLVKRFDWSITRLSSQNYDLLLNFTCGEATESDDGDDEEEEFDLDEDGERACAATIGAPLFSVEEKASCAGN